MAEDDRPHQGEQIHKTGFYGLGYDMNIPSAEYDTMKLSRCSASCLFANDSLIILRR